MVNVNSQQPQNIESLGHNVFAIDFMERQQPYRSAAYLIAGDVPVLIETGSSLSHDRLVDAMAILGLTPADLAYVILTHVHLDHAGGAGQMMQKAKNAQLLVHSRGARHMADPSRLWTGARSVYGAQLEALFGAVEPVSQAQIVVKQHGDTLTLPDRTLSFFDSPGHAKHHLTILDDKMDALYAGDAVGLRYRTGMTGWDFEFIMPSTSPIDFDPVAIHQTLDFLSAQPFSTVYHTHFGASRKSEAIAETRRVADEFAALIARIYTEGIGSDAVIAALREWVQMDLRARGFVPGPIEAIDIDIVLDAMGLIYYESARRSSLSGSP